MDTTKAPTMQPVTVFGRIRAMSRMIAMLILLAWHLSCLLIVSAIRGEDEQRGFRYRRRFTGAAMRALGIRLTVQGEPVATPALYISNHRSFVDPLIQLRYIDAYAVAKAEIAGYPLVGRGARETGVVFVKRENKESRSASRDAIRSLLASGNSVLIYAEGTTSNEAETLPFRIGSFEIAAELGIPVVPVMIDYADPAHYWHGLPMLSFFIRKFAAERIHATLIIGTANLYSNPQQAMEATRHWIGQRIRLVRESMD